MPVRRCYVVRCGVCQQQYIDQKSRTKKLAIRAAVALGWLLIPGRTQCPKHK